MKPVNLLPPKTAAAAAPSAGPNLGIVGGAAACVVLVLFVAGYFAMARVDSVKSETAKLQADAAQADSETQATRAQIASIGSPVADSDRDLAQGAEKVLVSAFTERHDFVRASREVGDVMSGTGGWLTQVDITAAGASIGSEGDTGGRAVRMEGYMPTKELLAGFNDRVNGRATFENATTDQIKSERLTRKGKKGTYWHFVLVADLVDTVKPSADGGSGAITDPALGGSTVSDSASDDSLTLSLDPEPVTRKPAAKATPKAPVATKKPLELAATAAAGGGAL